jgi:hypothetical protein
LALKIWCKLRHWHENVGLSWMANFLLINCVIQKGNDNKEYSSKN